MARTLVPVQLATQVAPGGIIVPAPSLEIHQDGVLDSGIVGGDVTVRLASPGSAVLSGTLTRDAAGGAVSFDDLSVDVAGNYELVAECDEASLYYTPRVSTSGWSAASGKLSLYYTPDGSVTTADMYLCNAYTEPSGGIRIKRVYPTASTRPNSLMARVNNGWVYTGTLSWTNGIEYLLEFLWDGSGMKFYCNGVQIPLLDGTATQKMAAPFATYCYIGAGGADGSAPCGGSIRDFLYTP